MLTPDHKTVFKQHLQQDMPFIFRPYVILAEIISSWLQKSELGCFVSLLGSLEVVVLQGQEPPSFLQLFRGGLVVHKGKRDEAPKAGSV